MYQYQEAPRFFAQIAGGSEAWGAEELAEFGASEVTPVYRGAYFEADKRTLYRVNYRSRIATRVIAPLLSFGCHSADYLYRRAGEIDWSEFLQPDQTFAVFANVSNSKIRHSKYAALRVKDAVVDQFREQTGRRPGVDTRSPDLWLNLYIVNNHAVLGVGTSGGSLHRRGYRESTGGAPLQETVAAAIIRLTDWQGERPLYDPLCGSGTLLGEALMHYCRIPSGYLRDHFGFEALPDFDEKLWKEVKEHEDGGIRPIPQGLLGGSDRDSAAVGAARANLAALPYGEHVKIQEMDFRALDGLTETTIVTNPPYGVRMGKRTDLGNFYRQLGDFLKQRCTGSTAYIYVGKPALLKSVGLRTSWKKPLVNGAMEGRLAKYELY